MIDSEWRGLEASAAYDIVVIGGGASGLSAALEAVRCGARVALLEKAEAVGGNSQFAEGFCAIGSAQQRAEGIDVPKGRAFNELVEYSHYLANPEIISRFIDNSAETYDILHDLGVEVHLITSFDPEGVFKVWHLVKGHVAAATSALEAAARKADADIFTSTRARHLLTAGGQVTGVVAEDTAGELIRIDAKAVIIASGGYTSNAQMRAQYITAYKPDNVTPNDHSDNHGDGIIMAFEAGADSFGLGLLMLNGATVEGKTLSSHLNNAATQPYLWVNVNGRRFISEMAVMEFNNAGNILAHQPGGIQFTIFDEATKRHLIEDGNEVGVGAYVFTGAPLTQLEAELREDLAAGEVAFQGDSIEDLAVKIGVDSDALTQTVADYNAACHAGVDTLFYKPKFLRPVEQAPFYALKAKDMFVTSLGGIKIDAKMRVIDTAGERIPGLYAAGVDAGGMWGDTYPARFGGISCGFALTSGRLAARDAAAVIGL
jgi:fumarate reductase flavoprotein subunit